MAKEEVLTPKKLSILQRADARLAGLQRISTTEQLFFIQQLSVMIKAGIPLARALEALAKQTRNQRFKAILADINTQVLAGTTLAVSLQPHRAIFGELFINMIRAGEASGTLEEVLNQLYLQLKKNHQLLSKVRGALAYPAVVLVAMTLIGVGVMLFVVPKFIDIFAQVDAELPLMTQALITLSNAVTAHGVLAGLAVLSIGIGVIVGARTTAGRYRLHWLILRLPVIAPIVQKINLARFARTMGSLLKTDIKIVEAFTITASTLRNVHYQASLREASEKITKGTSIADVLSSYPHLYNETILQMVAVGEESGELDGILNEIAGFYENEVESIMETLPTLIEPLIIIVLAVGIGAMAIAIIMPMYSLTNAF